MAVGRELVQRDCQVCLIISPKEIDQQAVRSMVDMETLVVPAVGLSGGPVGWARFIKGFFRSYRTAMAAFRRNVPRAVLGMGGFTSAPPMLGGRRLGVRTFLHESNAVPGRANRWLARGVEESFVYFPEAAHGLRPRPVRVTGMPVRREFEPQNASACRMALGLDARCPVLLIMGGSQGAQAINEAVMRGLPELSRRAPGLQYVHLTGAHRQKSIQATYQALGLRALVKPFLTEMELALGAATLALSRAGASSLAELAAMRVPAILVPYPFAADDHQERNAMGVAGSGGAIVLRQRELEAGGLPDQILTLLADEESLVRMGTSLGAWHTPGAAEAIAGRILEALDVDGVRTRKRAERASPLVAATCFLTSRLPV
jgi:UDP-N-acetylglucosamine--N-acetylmuramyl-(pentapeptide) pyrophosphoryl-undecaprenol N-acetylglucosamine transferase